MLVPGPENILGRDAWQIVRKEAVVDKHRLPETLTIASCETLEASCDRQSLVPGDIGIIEHADGVMTLDKSPADSDDHEGDGREFYRDAFGKELALQQNSERQSKGETGDIISDKD